MHLFGLRVRRFGSLVRLGVRGLLGVGRLGSAALQFLEQMAHLTVLGIGVQDGLAGLDRQRRIPELVIHLRELPESGEVIRRGLDHLLQLHTGQRKVPGGAIDFAQHDPGADHLRELLQPLLEHLNGLAKLSRVDEFLGMSHESVGC